MDKEQWMPIPGFHDYFASDLGKIKRRYKNGKVKFLSSSKMKRYDRIKSNGAYSQISLSLNGKVYKKLVHRLILMSFCPIEKDDEFVVNHKDGKKENNILSNLEWISEAQNKKHAASLGLMERGSNRYNSKLEEADVSDILRLKYKISQKQLSKIYGVNQSLISRIQSGSAWKHVKK